MKKRIMILSLLPLLVIAFSGVSQAWQGRMGGMGDPYGLLSDESSFLVHPAKVVNGEGVRFYGDYRFAYTGVTSWDYNLDQYTPAGVLANYFRYDGSGQEYRHNVLVGAAFPLGSGRMGAFFTYDGLRGDYDGNEDILGTGNFAEYELTKDLDNFALRLLYGLPLGGGFNAGGEVEFAYRQEENKNWMWLPTFVAWRTNYLFGTINAYDNLTPFQLPYDSSYWESLLKGSLDGKVGPLDLEFTLRGGFIFGGDNNLLLEESDGYFDAEGTVTGWRIGGDVWVRYPLTEDFSLPFLVRLDYQHKARDGDSFGMGTLPPTDYYPYESQEQNLCLEAGGGVDKDFGTGTTIAGGIYYNYLQGNYDIEFMQIRPGGARIWDHSNYPASTEHRVILRLAGEREFSPAVTLRMGLTPFVGWVTEDFTFTYTAAGTNDTDDISLDGFRWGIGASLGGTFTFKPITLEPFVAFTYQQIKLDGDGDRTNIAGTITQLWEMDKSRDEWYVGGGCSFLYDMP
jgi:hypothetical protein